MSERFVPARFVPDGQIDVSHGILDNTTGQYYGFTNTASALTGDLTADEINGLLAELISRFDDKFGEVFDPAVDGGFLASPVSGTVTVL